MIRKYLNMKKI